MTQPEAATAEPADPADQHVAAPAPPGPADGSWERVEQLRRALAELETTTARQREELAEQEALWEAAEAQRRHRERVAEARAEFEAAHEVYRAAAAHADAVYAELHAATCRIAGLYRSAVRAERACQDAGPALRAGRARLAEFGEDVAGTEAPAARQLVFAPGDPRRGAMLAGLLAYPATRRELAQLDAPMPLPSPTAPDLDELLTRIDARRRDAARSRPGAAVAAG